MVIKDKNILKEGIKKEIDLFVKYFSIHFLGNILLIVAFLVVVPLLGGSLSITFGLKINALEAHFFIGSLIGLIIILPIVKILIDSFLRNIKILNNIRKGDYNFGIESHEMDNMIEFIEDLPIKIEDVNRLKKSLSFGKIVEVLEATRIITPQKGVYYLDIYFKYKFDDIIVEDFEK